MKIRTSKKAYLLGAILMILTLVAVSLTVSAAITSDTSGECGNGVNWSYTDEDNTLRIWGSGMMDDYGRTDMPWYPMKNQISRIVIEDGVTHIGELAFYGFPSVFEVILPESAVSIGRYAFYDCRRLESITIPEGVTSIGQYAFRKTALVYAAMSFDGWSVGGNALNTITDETEAAMLLTSPDENLKLYTYAWRRATVTEAEEIANGVCGENVTWTLYSDGLLNISGSGDMKDCGAYDAPWADYKNMISKVVIGEGITSVGKCAFYGCFELTSVSLPSTIVSIDKYAFYDCRMLGAVTIPANVEDIGAFAFRKCYSAKSITLENPSGWTVDSEALDTEELKDGEYVWKQLSEEKYKKAWKGECHHNYIENVKEAPTTFENGLSEFICSKCGDSYEAGTPATKSLKLLAIGNSFSQDAFAHLYTVCKDAGIEELILGNLYIGGCSLEKHYNQMTNDTAGYIFYLSDDTAKGMVDLYDGEKCTAKTGIQYTDWDYITLQQNSANSGIASTYSYLDGVISYVKDHVKSDDVKLLWHMTWAYQGDSAHASFPNYSNDQMTMYNAIVSCVESEILTNSDMLGVVPSGTAIQNLRTSHLGDTLTRDGHHLSYGIGRYTAALTYLAAVTGYDVSSITATPSSEVAAHLPCIKEAVKNAIAKPYEVTPSADYPYVAPEEGILNTTLSMLTQDDKDYLTAKGYDPDGYRALDITIIENSYYDSRNDNTGKFVTPTSGSTYMKFLATQVFSRNELVVGSLIRVDSGYKYRPEGWKTDAYNTSATRPAVVFSADSELVSVTDEWWGDYEFRGFNICKGVTSANENITAEEAGNFRIYIPVAKKLPLNAEDIAYLEGLGLNPDKYLVLDYTYTLHGYYNASATKFSAISTGSSALHKEFLCTNQKYTRYDIPIGSIIRITDSDYRYRPEGWVTLNAKVASADRPERITASKVTVDAAWWGDWGYRAFNVQTKNSAQMTDAGAGALRIYVVADDKLVDLRDEDKTYLEGLGLNADDYMVLNYDYTVNAYYNSAQHSNIINTDTLFHRFTATEILTRDDLTIGSVIRLTKNGYQYRPDAWVSLSQKNTKRPGNVKAESVTVTEEWWGDFNYRAFNLSRSTDQNTITETETSALRIYVKVK